MLFKDSHQRHSCRSNHQSPLSTSFSPSLYTLVFAATVTQYYVFLLIFYKGTLGRQKVEDKYVGQLLYNHSHVFFSQCLPSAFHLSPGCLLSDPGAHGKHLFMSDLSFQPRYCNATLLSRARQSGV